MCLGMYNDSSVSMGDSSSIFMDIKIYIDVHCLYRMAIETHGFFKSSLDNL